MIRIEPLAGNKVSSNGVSCACLLIVRDSEDTIARCLDSILKANAFDQIVLVLDTRTKDNTPEILDSMAAMNPAITLAWYNWDKDDFSAARNQTLLLGETKYGFWMDSDDELIDTDSVNMLLARPGDAAYYYNIIIPTPYGRTVYTKHLRLFPMLPGVRWELPIHEQLAFSLRERGIPEIPTPYRILHLGYTSDEQIEGKHRRYLGIMEKWLREHPGPSQQRDYIMERASESRAYLEAKARRAI
jgi:glycosyltransferase involved in cell wall biosynthesis